MSGSVDPKQVQVELKRLSDASIRDSLEGGFEVFEDSGGTSLGCERHLRQLLTLVPNTNQRCIGGITFPGLALLPDRAID